MAAYYNEFDPFAAAWLRELIKAGLIADGEVDERSITDVQPEDVRGFTQCHCFAGIGGWSLALRLAGWDDARPVWTGSCPCQPFSAAGANLGGDDPRHLWPAWFRLIRECQPATVFGEQVEAAVAHGWLDLVCDDLEGEGYAVGAVGLPAASVGAPHIRQRLWFVAESDCSQPRGRSRTVQGEQEPERPAQQSDRCRVNAGELADARDGGRTEPLDGRVDPAPSRGQRIDRSAQGDAGHVDQRGTVEQLDDPDWQRAERAGTEEQIVDAGCAVEQLGHANQSGSQGRDGGKLSERADQRTPWATSDVVWLPCRDGKTRPTQSGLFPLAHGVSARVGRLRGYGNAIVAPLAAEFIKAYRAVNSENLHGL